jgi:glycosyltransferase involved in cell wall biosynthesis
MDRRGNPEHRLLALGHWGTYKRLEMLMDTFPQIAAQIPNVKLIVAGCDHPITPGYIESIAQKYRHDSCIEFAGYIPEEQIPELFRTTSLLLMPYSSSTGSSGVAHQAAEYGVPIVCADLPEFREMGEHEGLAIQFYDASNSSSFVRSVVDLLNSRSRLQEMSWRNYQAAQRMTLPFIVQGYLELFRNSMRKKNRTRELTEPAVVASPAIIPPESDTPVQAFD